MNDLGNSLKIVSTVYVAILLPWAFLYLHDFISDRWQTIRRTAFNGFLHLVAVTLPLPYVIYYICLQARLAEPDYKEMFAATTAVVFSIYHFLRTLWGLYQLHRFRLWARDVARIMESASYTCRLSRGAHREPVTAPSRGSRRPWRSLLQSTGSSIWSMNSSQSRKVQGGFKNALSSNEGLQQVTSPPRLHESPASDLASLEAGLRHRVSAKVCSTHDLLNINLPAREAHNHGHEKNDPSQKERESRICWSIDRMLVNSTIIDNEFINSYSPFRLAASSWRLQPLRRKSTYIRWCVLYLAHFGRKWLEDCKTKPFSEDTWTGRRSNLSARVWGTAALRMETECQAVLTNQSSQSTSQGNFGASSFLDPCEWDRVTPAIEDQLFTKEHVLKECFVSGDGLPYNSPILDDRDQPLPSHGIYRPLLKEAMETLPTRYFEEVEDMTSDHIEWFAVFLWVRKWGGCVPHEIQSSSMSPTEDTTPEFKNKATAPLAPTDTPVRVLQDQLGLDSPPTRDVCAFPFVSHGYGRILWDNRSVLQVSARIDNWIGLCMGRQTAFLLENESDLGPGGEIFEKVHAPLTKKDKNSEVIEKPNEGTESVNSELDDDESRNLARSNAIVAFHEQLEVKRLRYQLANITPQHRHLEHGLTFMGCVMESVRSGIAETLTSTEEVKIWSPTIPDDEVSFAVSAQLMRCLRGLFCQECPSHFDSTVQERLLWECQNGVHCSWQNKLELGHFRGFSGSQPEVVEAMILCVLGFPSIHITSKNVRRESGKESIESLTFELWPVAGPQHLRLELVVSNWSSPSMSVKFRTQGTETSDGAGKQERIFRWQDWRDALEGRMIGKSEWQRTHSMRESQVRRTNKTISNGVRKMIIGEDDGDRPVPMFRRYLVWEGWRPFRAGMTLFELRHSSLIILGDAMPTDSYSPTDRLSDGTSTGTDMTMRRQDTKVATTTAYQNANTAALTDASIHLDALLSLDKDPFGDSTKPSADDDEERPESQLVDLVPAPSSSSDGPSFKMEFNFNPPLPSVIITRAQEQDPIAMHILAKWVLTGTKGFQKDHNKALLLMERALILGRYIMTARLLVKTLIDKTFMPDVPVDVDRALAAVELLWRDMAGRHEVVTIGNKRVRRWKGDSDAELARMSKLVTMHLKLVCARPTAEMIRNLADKLSMWGESRKDEETATVLYETAILANCDSKSIMELGRRFHRRNPNFAAAMYQRAMTVGQDAAAKHLADLLVSGKCDLKLSPRELAVVYERATRLGHVSAMRELGLLLLHGGEDFLSDIVRGKALAERAVYGETIARALERGAASLKIDHKRAEELRMAAERAFGSDSTNHHDTDGTVRPALRAVDINWHYPV